MAKKPRPNARKRHLQRLAAEADSTPLQAVIKQKDGQWCVFSEDGKKSFGCYDTEDEAKKRLGEVEHFKKAKGSLHAAMPTSILPGGDTSTLKPGQKHIVVQEAGAWTNYGESGHRLFTLADTLIEAARTRYFDGAKIYVNHQSEDEAERQPERDQGAVVGVVTDTRWDPSVGPMGALVGVANIVDPTLRARIENAEELGVLERFGSFSITAAGETEVRTIGGETYEVVTRFVPGAIPSVDHVTEPAAGGRFLTRLAASVAGRKEAPAMKWADLPDAIKMAILACDSDDKARELLAALDLKDADEELEKHMLAARAEAKPEPALEPAKDEPPPTPAPEPKPDSAEVAAALKRLEALEAEQVKLRAAQASNLLEATLKASGFDEPTQGYLRGQLKGVMDPAVIDKRIKAHRDYLAQREPEPEFPATMIRGSIEGGATELDKWQAAAEGFFYRDHGRQARTPVELHGAKIQPFYSLHELVSYFPEHKSKRYWTSVDLMAACRNRFYFGDETGGQVMRAGNQVTLRAAGSRSHFAECFADVANKVMQSLWSTSDRVDEVEAWASMVDELTNFNDKRYIQLGEYGNVSSVSEGGTYNTLTTPGDVEEKEGLTKYGFIESMTLEGGYWDEDGQKLAALPKRMIQALLRTFRETIINEITTTNPTLNSDSTALYDATGHSNSGTTALTVTGLNTTALAMYKQTAAGSSKRYGMQLRPWGIIVPLDLAHLAQRIAQPSMEWAAAQAIADTDASALIGHSKWAGIKVLVGDHLTNAKDWWTMADPSKFDTFVVQYLRGVRAPQFFAQDAETADSVFDSDQIKWKVRHFLGVEPLNYRAFYYQDVA